MNYFIYDQTGKKLDLLQNRMSVQWCPRYYETGTCEIHARPTLNNIKYLKKWNRIVCKERNEILFITFVKQMDDDMIIRGYLDNLDQRINLQTATIKNVEKGLLDIVNNNKRGMDVIVGEPKGLTHIIQEGSQTTFNTLRKDFEKYCQLTNLGWHMIVKQGKLNYLEIYEGQLKNRARFSDKIRNILDQQYEENMTKYRNFAYVYGEEKDTGRTYVTIDMRKDNEPILEMYVDARDLQSTYKGSDGQEHTYSEAEYKKLLAERGQDKLNETRINALTYSFSLDQDNAVAVLGKDYDLGDVVPVISTKYDLAVHARITGINFIEESNNQTQISIEVKLEEVKGVSL